MASMRSKTVSLRRFPVVVPAETMPDGEVTRRHDTVSLLFPNQQRQVRR